MPRPSFRSQANNSGGAAVVTLTLPTHATNDIIILGIETANQALTSNTLTTLTNQGYSEAPSSAQVGIGTAGAAGGTRQFVYWTRASSASQSAVVIDSTGNHCVIAALVIQNAKTDGSPFNTSANQRQTTAGTSVSFPQITTTTPNTLVVMLMTNDTDGTTAQMGTITNANLSSITEHTDRNINTGAGGGVAFATAANTGQGNIGNSTFTKAGSSVYHLWIAALEGTPDPSFKPRSWVALV